MPVLVVRGPAYCSQGDETAFFRWLRSIACVRRVTGDMYELRIDVKQRRITNRDLHELIAILFRYQLPMAALAIFKSSRNEHWFADPSMFWFDAVFAAKPKQRLKRSAAQLAR